MRLTRWERKRAEERMGWARARKRSDDFIRDLFSPRCLCGALGAFPCRRCFARFDTYVSAMRRRLYAEAALVDGRWADDGGRVPD